LATGKLTALSFGVAADDWNVLQTARPNVLLIGPDQAVRGFLVLLLPLLQPPIADTAESFALPVRLDGTLILRDVQALADDAQRRVSAWMAEPARRTQVISTASCQLYPLVERKVLAEALFYSLNVITLAVSQPVSA